MLPGVLSLVVSVGPYSVALQMVTLPFPGRESTLSLESWLGYQVQVPPLTSRGSWDKLLSPGLRGVFGFFNHLICGEGGLWRWKEKMP